MLYNLNVFQFLNDFEQVDSKINEHSSSLTYRKSFLRLPSNILPVDHSIINGKSVDNIK